MTNRDDKPFAGLIESWKPYYAASNEPTVLRDIARQMTQGDCGPASVKLRRGGETVELVGTRVRPAPPTPGSNWHDRPGDTFQIMPTKSASLKPWSVKQSEVASYIDRAAGTQGLIIDIRNYPSEFMPFALGSML